jgi:hypothetical protein
MVFELQDQLSTSEGMVASFTEASRAQQAKYDQVQMGLNQQQHDFEIAKQELTVA